MLAGQPNWGASQVPQHVGTAQRGKPVVTPPHDDTPSTTATPSPFANTRETDKEEKKVHNERRYGWPLFKKTPARTLLTHKNADVKDLPLGTPSGTLSGRGSGRNKVNVGRRRFRRFVGLMVLGSALLSFLAVFRPFAAEPPGAKPRPFWEKMQLNGVEFLQRRLGYSRMEEALDSNRLLPRAGTGEAHDRAPAVHNPRIRGQGVNADGSSPFVVYGTQSGDKAKERLSVYSSALAVRRGMAQTKGLGLFAFYDLAEMRPGTSPQTDFADPIALGMEDLTANGTSATPVTLVAVRQHSLFSHFETFLPDDFELAMSPAFVYLEALPGRSPRRFVSPFSTALRKMMQTESLVLHDAQMSGGSSVSSPARTAVFREASGFLRSIQSGAAKPYLRNENMEHKHEVHDVVLSVNSKFFSDQLMANRKEDEFFIIFYAPWCGHCKKFESMLAPLAAKLSRVANKKIGFYKVDATKNDVDHASIRLRYYPTTFFFSKFLPGGLKNPIEVQGLGREVDRYIPAFVFKNSHFGKDIEKKWTKLAQKNPDVLFGHGSESSLDDLLPEVEAEL